MKVGDKLIWYNQRQHKEIEVTFKRWSSTRNWVIVDWNGKWKKIHINRIEENDRTKLEAPGS